MNKLLLVIVVIALGSCNEKPTEKHQRNRNHIINVHDKVTGIDTGPLVFNEYNKITLLNDYLIIYDSKSFDDQVYLFNRDNFNFITSTAPVGQGPGEITNMGHLATNESQRLFYLTDYGKQKIFCYDLDSVLTNPHYMPEVKMNMNKMEFPSEYQYVNDTLSIGRIIKPTGNYGFNLYSARWNINTGEIHPMPDLHPEIKTKRYNLAVSMKNGICVESYQRHDLLTIRTLSGELKYDIYGPHWELSTKKKIKYFGDVIFCKDKILVLYSGTDAFTKNQHGDPVSVCPEKFMLFDLNGEYLKTLDVGYQIAHFCYDESNNRLILSMNDEIQFGYLELDGLID